MDRLRSVLCALSCPAVPCTVRALAGVTRARRHGFARFAVLVYTALQVSDNRTFISRIIGEFSNTYVNALRQHTNNTHVHHVICFETETPQHRRTVQLLREALTFKARRLPQGGLKA